MYCYQKFEYWVGHVLQKATEHVFGSVMCSPGCFSLFRAKALMHDNVMNTYTTKSEEPMHYVQYDQVVVHNNVHNFEKNTVFSILISHAPPKIFDFFIFTG